MPVLEARGLAKSFGPVEVLSDIDLALYPGEVHAIIGENGAGKSTLMKLMAGHLAPSRGSISLEGETLRFSGPVDAEKRGIVLVHQEILLAPHRTVAQNIFLGRELKRGFLTRDGEMNRLAAAALSDLGAEIDPRAVVASLSIAKRQLVQIARALQVPHKAVIFDEPTAALTPFETEALLKVIRDLRDRGIAVLYISHRLPEVGAIADRVTVLRDGRRVTTRSAEGLEPVEMARLMVGRDVSQLYPERHVRAGREMLLSVENFEVPGLAANISFTLHRGEILGFAGLIGAGRTELMEGIVGLRPSHGTLRIKDRPTRFSSADQSMKAGIVYLSEDRKGKGLLLDKTLATNLTLATLSRFTRGPMVDGRRENAALDKAFTDFDIRARRRSLLAGQLSGGNQQKLLLAKMMLADPKIVIIDEPTRGIDIGTKEQIYRFIAELAEAGKGVIVVSSEMQELIGICERIIVMRGGRMAGEVTGEAMTEDEIVMRATGVESVEEIEGAMHA
ncbi:sugar ABC transporter ATP-binding protein [Pararhizobium mangrovi]|uniref:Sugar ABC transporter ATP-binding protein n=1 Tax=Pararhizobium mangrovi TaxID=2590452 RepID=A0A506U0U9_9HYPH|nr:sugar ABC transporter ATP-binding protein [Pararhizobium mangrovi]TPW27983.1 sugar ABC transporter ATP-binding protein [Pararhizobium mangrovi]